MTNQTSPVIVDQALPARPCFGFCLALQKLLEGIKVTKAEWGSDDIYLVLVDGKLMLHKADGKLYNLIVSDGDITGQDYVIVE